MTVMNSYLRSHAPGAKSSNRPKLTLMKAFWMNGLKANPESSPQKHILGIMCIFMYIYIYMYVCMY